MARKTIAEHEIKFLLTAENATKAAFGTIKKALPDIKTAALAAGAAITAFTAAATVGVKEAVFQFADFEESLVDVARVSDQSLGDIKKQIMDLPNALGSATDLVRGYYNVISSGVTDPKQALDLLTVAAKGSQAAHVDLKETVAGLTNLMDGFGGALDGAAEASDKLFTIERIGKVEFQSLIPVIGQVSAAANLLNVNVDELGGLFATVSKTAGSTETAATQVKAIFNSMLKPTSAMTAALKDMGFSSGAVAIESRGLQRIFEDLNKQVSAGTVTFTELFSNQRALVGIGPSLKDNFKTLGANIEEMGKSAGATDKAFENWRTTLKGIYNTFKNTIGKIAIEIGSALAPDIKKALEDVGGYLKENKDEIIVWVKSFIVGFRGILEALEPFKNAVVAAFNFIATNIPPIIIKIVDVLGEFKNGLFGVEEQAKLTADATEESFKRMSAAKLEPVDIKLTEGVDPTAPFFTRLGQLFGTLGKTIGNALFDINEATENFKIRFLNWSGEILKSFGGFVVEMLGEWDKIVGFNIGDAVFGNIEKFRSAHKDMIGRLDTVNQSVKEISETINDTEPVLDIGTDVAIDKLSAVKDEAADLQAKFSDINVKVTVSDKGILQLSDLKDELESPVWGDILVKNVAVNTDAATASVNDIRAELDKIPREKNIVFRAEFGDLKAKTDELKSAFISTADAFIKQNEKLLQPLRDAAGKLPEELTAALSAGRKVFLAEGGFMVEAAADNMKEAAKTSMPEVAVGMLESLNSSLRDNTDLTDGAVVDIMDGMIRLMEADSDKFKVTGESILKSISEGVFGAAPKLEAVMDKTMQAAVDDYLPHSPAKKGPLASIDTVGAALINSIADGITASSGSLSSAMTQAMGEVVDILSDLTAQVSNIPPVTIDTNIDEMLSDLRAIPPAISAIPEITTKTVNVDTEIAIINIETLKEILESIPDNIRRTFLIDIEKALLAVSLVKDQLISIPEITTALVDVETEEALMDIDEVISELNSIPDITRTFILNADAAFHTLDRFALRLEEIPETIFRTLVLDVQTQASPRRPFGKGMDEIENRISNLPQRSNLIIDTEVPTARAAVPGLLSKQDRPQVVNQDIGITVNIKADGLAPENIDSVAGDIGRAIARQLNTGRVNDLNAAIKRLV